MLNCSILSVKKANDYKGLKSVSLPGYYGKMQILSGHTEMFCILRQGNVVLKNNNIKKIIQIPKSECYIKNNNIKIFSSK